MPENPKTGDFYHIKVNSKNYDKYAYMDIDKEKGIKGLLGIWTDKDGKHSEISSYLFDKEKWTLKDAKEWVKEHKKSKASNVIVKAELLDEDKVFEDALSKAGLKKNKDLLYTTFKLCHVGSNENQDEFEFEELKNYYNTAKFKPIDWEHENDDIIGVVYDSEFVEEPKPEDDAVPYIRAFGVIYKSKFPDKAEEMKRRHEAGNLFYSMEVWFEKAACSECGKEFESSDVYCNHLRDRLENKTTSRKLRGITFGGAGVVVNPADKKASSLSIAKKETPPTFEHVFSYNYDVLKKEILTISLEDMVDEDEKVQKQNRVIWAFNDAITILFSDVNLAKEKKIERFNDFSTQLLKILELVDTDNLGGNKIMSEVLFKTEEEYRNAISQSDMVKDLNSKITNLTNELDLAIKDKERLETEKDALATNFEKYKLDTERDKLIASRVDVLVTKYGISDEKITDKIKEGIAKFSDEEFDLWGETFFVKAGANAQVPLRSVASQNSKESFDFDKFFNKVL